MRLPPLFRTTAFRLTLLFVLLFAASAGAFLAYVYLSTAGEVTRVADRAVLQEAHALEAVDRSGGEPALLRRIADSAANDRPFLYLLQDPAGRRIGGSLVAAPESHGEVAAPVWMAFDSPIRARPEAGGGRRLARGVIDRLPGGDTLTVATDVTFAQAFVFRIARAMWGAGAIVVLLGLAGGLLISRNVNRSVARLNDVVAAVRGGDLGARVDLLGAHDELESWPPA